MTNPSHDSHERLPHTSLRNTSYSRVTCQHRNESQACTRCADQRKKAQDRRRLTAGHSPRPASTPMHSAQAAAHKYLEHRCCTRYIHSCWFGKVAAEWRFGGAVSPAAIGTTGVCVPAYCTDFGRQFGSLDTAVRIQYPGPGTHVARPLGAMHLRVLTKCSWSLEFQTLFGRRDLVRSSLLSCMVHEQMATSSSHATCDMLQRSEEAKPPHGSV